VLRLTWVQDQLAHVLESRDTDEPPGIGPICCPDHEVALGTDMH
jgi:hypothetical protein